MNRYLPEGRNPHQPPYTTEELQRALFNGEILEAIAIKCDEHHNLHVNLGNGLIGLIPRAETALGVQEGSLRDIAILSRVGKPVCFRVQELPPEDLPLLSRRDAQEEARACFLQKLTPGDILPATILNLTDFGAFCDIGCGIPALLSIENISVSRISHSADRFREGQRIYVVVKSIDRERNRIFLTHKELLGTWQENILGFQAGQTVMGIVRSIREYGAFVELTPNLSGLTDPIPGLHEGDAVSVYIKSILPEKQKIKLVVLSHLDADLLPSQPITYYKTTGHLSMWAYSPHLLTFF